jgi:hypothetical protein
MDAGVAWFALAVTAIVALVALPRGAGLRLQSVVIGLGVVVLVTFEGCVGQEYDAGGNPVLAMANVTEARNRGEEVAIKGTCNSSCALRLAAGSSLCVSPQAEIGVHEVRRVSRLGDYQRGVRDNLWTGFFEGMLPACARDLFNARHGFASGRLAVVSGAEILRACPTIRACAPQ